eukprot:3913524-Pleurochrysis_carterae.AAC.1
MDVGQAKVHAGDNISAERDLFVAASSARSFVYVLEAGKSERRVQLANSADSNQIYRWHGRGAGCKWAMESFKRLEVVLSPLGSTWRQKSSAVHTNDPFKQTRHSVEFGWSTFPGGSVQQLQRLWAALLESFPEAGDALYCAHKRHSSAGTGSTKVTIAVNNPSHIHTDHRKIDLLAHAGTDSCEHAARAPECARLQCDRRSRAR